MESRSSLNSRHTSRRYFKRDDCRWFWFKSKSKSVELNSFYSGACCIRFNYFLTMLSQACCGRRTASAVDLWRSVSHSPRRWQRRRFCHHWKFHVQTESYCYASLPTYPCDADAAITGSRFASLGDVPFYRSSVNTGDGDTALIFASDGHLELLRSCRLVYVDATFRVVPSLYYQLFTVFPSHRSLVSSDSLDHDPENNCTV